MRHPTEESLNAFRVGKLDHANWEAIAQHIDDCEQCTLFLLQHETHDELETCLAGLKSWEQLLNDQTEGLSELLLRHPRYEILRPLGQGGMGQVILARHKVMDRLVALKVVRPDLAASTVVGRSRFLKEVTALSKLSHPNIAAALDAEQEGSNLLLVMEFIDGIDVEHLVNEKGPLPLGMACYIASEVIRGLRHAELQGIVHRDIKPSNIMFSHNSEVKILDFGLASLREGKHGHETASGAILGTPQYISPEQATNAKHVDLRADEYSLGCTLFFMLTGSPVFDFESSAEMIAAHLKDPPRPPRQLNPEIPYDLNAIILRMLSKKPENRFGDYGLLTAALMPFVQCPAESQIGDLIATARQHLQNASASANAKESLINVKPKPTVSLFARRRIIFGAVLGIGGLGLLYGRSLLFERQREPQVLVVVPFDSYYAGDYDRVVKALRGRDISFRTASSAPGIAKEYRDPYMPEQYLAINPATIDIVVEAQSVSDLMFDIVIFTGAYPIENLEFAYNKSDLATLLITKTIERGGMVGAVCGAIDVLAVAKQLSFKRAAKAEYLKDSTRLDSRIEWVADQAVVAADQRAQVFSCLRSEDAGALVTTMLDNYFEK
ncbi:MAG: serine/threonine protein kinase [Planctomycetales bacterium]|nr:serine/threonine protein kinase [Planctomycetales bacterium]